MDEPIWRALPGHAWIEVAAGDDSAPQGRIRRNGQIGAVYRIGPYWATYFQGQNEYMHRLILWAFVGECPYMQEACHKDDNPSNNRLLNLEWNTHMHNMRMRNNAHICDELCALERIP